MSWESTFSYPADLAEPFPRVVHPTEPIRPRRCNFCLRIEPAVRFKKEAHILPKALGRPRLLSRRECDDCNARGAKLESDLAAHLGVHRAFAGQLGREGHPTVRMGKFSYMKWDPERCATFAHLDPIDFIDDFAEQGGLAFRVPTYRPMNVCRALARMALFFVDDPARYPRTRAWVLQQAGSARAKSPAVFRMEFEAPLPRAFLVVKQRVFGDNVWYRVVYGFHTALFVMCVGEPEWGEPSIEDQLTEFTTPISGDTFPPGGEGHLLRFDEDTRTTYPYPTSPGAIRRPPWADSET